MTRTWIVLGLAVLGAIPFRPVPAGAPTAPALPPGTLDTTMPPITGNTYPVNAGGNLQLGGLGVVSIHVSSCIED